ncbi:MAG: 4-hydroxy-tetrahydrodipicolinate reductase, partial [Actinobacteria bacterium]|nr:4-hydroxy-tetrahydrodipicolinate reductase [Actinomycetota bacterium]
MTRVGVFGAGGRMGTTVCRAVAAAPGLELVAAVDPGCTGARLSELAGGGVPDLEAPDLEVQGDAEALAAAGAEVAVDFTRAEAARANLRWCAGHGVHAVVGTTGLGEEDLAELGRMFPGDPGSTNGATGCLVAPNFAIGAVLLMRMAELAAPWFETAEVIELHHDGKVDAPSGTALLTAQRMAAASDSWGADPTTDEVLAGARGGIGPAGIHVHSVRLRGLVAHQEVLFGTAGQSLTIRHDSYDRTSFMPGVLLAVRA